MLRYIVSLSYAWKCYPDIFRLVNFEVKNMEMGPYDTIFTLNPEFKVFHVDNVYKNPPVY